MKNLLSWSRISKVLKFYLYAALVGGLFELIRVPLSKLIVSPWDSLLAGLYLVSLALMIFWLELGPRHDVTMPKGPDILTVPRAILLISYLPFRNADYLVGDLAEQFTVIREEYGDANARKWLNIMLIRSLVEMLHYLCRMLISELSFRKRAVEKPVLSFSRLSKGRPR